MDGKNYESERKEVVSNQSFFFFKVKYHKKTVAVTSGKNLVGVNLINFYIS